MKWLGRDRDCPKHTPDIIRFCTDVVLNLTTDSILQGFTEHKRVNSGRDLQLIFHAHPCFKADSAQRSTVWYNWATFAFQHRTNAKKGAIIPGQILCFLKLKNLKKDRQNIQIGFRASPTCTTKGWWICDKSHGAATVWIHVWRVYQCSQNCSSGRLHRQTLFEETKASPQARSS